MKSAIFLCGLAFVVFLFSLEIEAGHHDKFQAWSNHGGTTLNQRYIRKDTKIKANKVHKLQVKWTVTTGGSVSATPSVTKELVYFPDWAGNLFAVNRATGAIVWQRTVASITGTTGDLSRASPTIYDDYLLCGTQGTGQGAKVYALDRFTGDTRWVTQVDTHIASVITQSGVAHNGYYYIGVSSLEEGFAANPAYPCCSFAGSFHKLRISDGSIECSQTTIGNGLTVGVGAYSGNAVWGSSPSIDTKRNQVYIGTGNNYAVPPEIQQCFNDAQDAGTSSDHCVEEGNHIDSVMALKMEDDEEGNSCDIVWSTAVQGLDAWTVACFFGGPNCPDQPGPDYDFGMAPMFIPATGRGNNRGSSSSSGCHDDDDSSSGSQDGHQKDLIVIGQKSGFVWHIDPDDGSTLRSVAAGPGGELGGNNWGASTDTKVSYIPIINSNSLDYVLAPGAEVVNTGGWAAVRNRDGEIQWTVAVPPKGPLNYAAGPTTVINNVMFAGATDAVGSVYAFDVKTGEIKWSDETGGSIYGGFSGDGEGCVYVGSGYRPDFIPGFTANNKVYAYCMP